MSIDVEAMVPRVRAIFSAPGVDLSTISSKRVRKQLVEDGMLTSEEMKENKEVLDTMIQEVYSDMVNGAKRAAEEEQIESANAKRKWEEEEEEEEEANGVQEQTEEDEEMVEEEKPKKSRKSKAAQSDAELARQLSNELNGRPRSSRAAAASSSGRRTRTNGAKKRGKKSAATVDSDAEISGDETPTKKRRAGGGFQKEFLLSEPLSAVVNSDKLSRPQVVKQLWAYIKENSLQNPSNKREIMCDANLKALFNSEKVNMFTMNKLLGQHLHEQEG